MNYYDEIRIKDRTDFEFGEYGVFFDVAPWKFIKKVKELNGFSKLPTIDVDFELSECNGCGKHQVLSSNSYWNYYIPESEFTKMWDSQKHETFDWGRR